MKKSVYLIVLLFAFASMTTGQTIVIDGEFNPEEIKSELAKKYHAFEGRLEDQTVDMWDTYFLKSSNVGNMHEGRPEIGWETVHKGSIEYVNSKPVGK